MSLYQPGTSHLGLWPDPLQRPSVHDLGDSVIVGLADGWRLHIPQTDEGADYLRALAACADVTADRIDHARPVTTGDGGQVDDRT